MGKPTGFLEYLRQLPTDRSPLQRIQDWDEFHTPLPEETLRTQGARCMDCGTPFCHTGLILNRMASGCPLHNLIPEWNDLIYRDLWHEALQRLHRTNPFPEFTGRVCPAPCEGSCVLGITDPPVTIKSNECAIADRGWEEGWITPHPPAHRTGRTVAVVGSGPAGLSAATQLNKAGHWVTVFERADRPGGLLTYGIPNMKLDKALVVQRRLDLMQAEGVTFVCNTEIGKDRSIESVQQEFDAVILCIGATRPRDLGVEGRSLQGIHFAMDYLTASTRALLDRDRNGHFITAENKDVVIIGGGDTGTDCVGTSLRQGCRSVVQLEIMPKPPLQRADDNPWPEFPKIYKLDYGQEEAQAKFGSDPRSYLTTVTQFDGDPQGRLRAVHTVQVEWRYDAQGRIGPRPIPGTERVLPAQLVLLAMGFLGPEPGVLESLGVERDSRSTVKTEAGIYATTIPGVFAAGDCRRGQSLVVWAIQEGKEVALACDHFLQDQAKGHPSLDINLTQADL